MGYTGIVGAAAKTRKKPVDREALLKILDALRSARSEWCKETVDDAEEMWVDIPPMLDWVVPAMESALRLTPTTLIIESAKYGAGNQYKDVLSILEEMRVGDFLEIFVDNKYLGGDPVPMVPKELIVTYYLKGNCKTVRTPEGKNFRIDSKSTE